MPFYESPEEFIARQGGKVNLFRSGNTLLFRNGARVVRLGLGATDLREPPVDPKQLLLARREYHSAWLDRIASDFNTLKAVLSGMKARGLPTTWSWNGAVYGEPPSANMNGEDVLLHFKHLAEEHREEIAAIEEELSSLPEYLEEQERKQVVDQMRAEQSMQAARDRARIQEINL